MNPSDADSAAADGGSNLPGTSVPMRHPSNITPEVLRTLADHADLPLATGREKAVAAVLGAWLPDVNALCRKMSAPEHQELAPATTFIHPDIGEGEA